MAVTVVKSICIFFIRILHRSLKYDFWAGILGNHVFCTLLFEEDLSREIYLQMLQNTIEPLQIEENNPEEFDDLEIVSQ